MGEKDINYFNTFVPFKTECARVTANSKKLNYACLVRKQPSYLSLFSFFFKAVSALTLGPHLSYSISYSYPTCWRVPAHNRAFTGVALLPKWSPVKLISGVISKEAPREPDSFHPTNKGSLVGLQRRLIVPHQPWQRSPH